MEAPVVIGLDVGGTKILSGPVEREGHVVAEHEVPSPDGSEQGVLAALDACTCGGRGHLEVLVSGSAGDLVVLEPARESARAEAVTPANRTLRVVPAELGSEAGLVGAGLVGFEALDGIR